MNADKMTSNHRLGTRNCELFLSNCQKRGGPSRYINPNEQFIGSFHSEKALYLFLHWISSTCISLCFFNFPSNMDHKEHFYKLLDTKIEQIIQTKRAAFCVTQDRYDDILDALNLPKGVSCRNGKDFKRMCLRYFKVITIGTKTLVYSLETNTPLTTREDLFDVLKQ